MQSLSLQPAFRMTSVQRIGHQRVPQRSHVHANLVRAPSVQRAAHQAVRGIPIQQIKVCLRSLAGVQIQVHHRHAQAVARVATNGRADFAVLACAPVLVGNGQVLAAHISRGNHFDERIHGATVARHHHQAAGVFIQTVNNARARHLARFFVARQQAVEQRARPVTGRRVHHQTGRLVDDEQVIIFIDHLQIHGFGLEGHRLLGGAHFHAQLVTHRHFGRRLGQHLAIERDRAIGQQLLQIAARELGYAQRQHLVGALAMVFSGGDQLAPLDFRTANRVFSRFIPAGFSGVCHVLRLRRHKPLRGRGLCRLRGFFTLRCHA